MFIYLMLPVLLLTNIWLKAFVQTKMICYNLHIKIDANILHWIEIELLVEATHITHDSDTQVSGIVAFYWMK